MGVTENDRHRENMRLSGFDLSLVCQHASTPDVGGGAKGSKISLASVPNRRTTTFIAVTVSAREPSIKNFYLERNQNWFFITHDTSLAKAHEVAVLVLSHFIKEAEGETRWTFNCVQSRRICSPKPSVYDRTPPSPKAVHVNVAVLIFTLVLVCQRVPHHQRHSLSTIHNTKYISSKRKKECIWESHRIKSVWYTLARHPPKKQICQYYTSSSKTPNNETISHHVLKKTPMNPHTVAHNTHTHIYLARLL